jgi:hypothetical protein
MQQKCLYLGISLILDDDTKIIRCMIHNETSVIVFYKSVGHTL